MKTYVVGFILFYISLSAHAASIYGSWYFSYMNGLNNEQTQIDFLPKKKFKSRFIATINNQKIPVQTQGSWLIKNNQLSLNYWLDKITIDTENPELHLSELKESLKNFQEYSILQTLPNYLVLKNKQFILSGVNVQFAQAQLENVWLKDTKWTYQQTSKINKHVTINTQNTQNFQTNGTTKTTVTVTLEKNDTVIGVYTFYTAGKWHQEGSFLLLENQRMRFKNHQNNAHTALISELFKKTQTPMLYNVYQNGQNIILQNRTQLTSVELKPIQ